MKLFRVQDGDRPMWVAATDYADAVKRWQEVIRRENPDDDEDSFPSGVEFVCGSDDYLP